MPTEVIELNQTQAEFIRQSVAAGDFEDASEVVREGLRLLQQRRSEEAAKLELLRAELKEGVDAYEQGDFIELNSREDIGAYFDDVNRRGRERLAKDTNASATSAD